MIMPGGIERRADAQAQSSGLDRDLLSRLHDGLRRHRCSVAIAPRSNRYASAATPTPASPGTIQSISGALSHSSDRSDDSQGATCVDRIGRDAHSLSRERALFVVLVGEVPCVHSNHLSRTSQGECGRVHCPVGQSVAPEIFTSSRRAPSGRKRLPSTGPRPQARSRVSARTGCAATSLKPASSRSSICSIESTNTPERGVWYGSQGPQRIVIGRSLAEHSSRLVSFAASKTKNTGATTMRRFDLKGLNSPYLVRASLRARDKIVAQMADDMRVIETRRGSVDAEDLELLGWLPSQINSCGADARRCALRDSVRSVMRDAA